jgi:hypothetical protein
MTKIAEMDTHRLTGMRQEIADRISKNITSDNYDTPSGFVVSRRSAGWGD